MLQAGECKSGGVTIAVPTGYSCQGERGLRSEAPHHFGTWLTYW
jgi:hypothetical protein